MCKFHPTRNELLVEIIHNALRGFPVYKNKQLINQLGLKLGNLTVKLVVDFFQLTFLS